MKSKQNGHQWSRVEEYVVCIGVYGSPSINLPSPSQEACRPKRPWLHFLHVYWVKSVQTPRSLLWKTVNCSASCYQCMGLSQCDECWINPSHLELPNTADLLRISASTSASFLLLFWSPFNICLSVRYPCLFLSFHCRRARWTQRSTKTSGWIQSNEH